MQYKLVCLFVTSVLIGSGIANYYLLHDYKSLQSNYTSMSSSYTAIYDELKNTKITLDEIREVVDSKPAIPEFTGTNKATIYEIPLSSELQQFTYDVCCYFNIPTMYEYILAIMWQESRFEADKISSTNDYGLMQINASNAKFLHDTLGVSDLLNEVENIYSGVYLISYLLDRYSDIEKALMVYNMGPTTASSLWQRGIYTAPYSDSVLTYEKNLKNSIYIE